MRLSIRPPLSSNKNGPTKDAVTVLGLPKAETGSFDFLGSNGVVFESNGEFPRVNDTTHGSSLSVSHPAAGIEIDTVCARGRGARHQAGGPQWRASTR